MDRAILRNATAAVFLAGLSLAYLDFVGSRVPPEHALLTNFVLVPLLFGVLGWFMFAGSLAIKLLLVLPLPMLHLLYFGSDPAKPGLENVLAVVEFGFVCLGIVLSHFARKLVRRDHSP